MKNFIKSSMGQSLQEEQTNVPKANETKQSSMKNNSKNKPTKQSIQFDANKETIFSEGKNEPSMQSQNNAPAWTRLVYFEVIISILYVILAYLVLKSCSGFFITYNKNTAAEMFEIGNNCQCLIEALRCLLCGMISAYLVCKLDVCARNPNQSEQGYALTKSEEEDVAISHKKETSLAEKEGMQVQTMKLQKDENDSRKETIKITTRGDIIAVKKNQSEITPDLKAKNDEQNAQESLLSPSISSVDPTSTNSKASLLHKSDHLSSERAKVKSKRDSENICNNLRAYLSSLEKLRGRNGVLSKLFTSQTILSFIECVLIVVLIVLFRDIVQIVGVENITFIIPTNLPEGFNCFVEHPDLLMLVLLLLLGLISCIVKTNYSSKNFSIDYIKNAIKTKELIQASATQEKFSSNENWYKTVDDDRLYVSPIESESLSQTNQGTMIHESLNRTDEENKLYESPTENQDIGNTTHNITRSSKANVNEEAKQLIPCNTDIILRLVFVLAIAISLSYLMVFSTCKPESLMHCLAFMCGCYLLLEILCQAKRMIC